MYFRFLAVILMPFGLLVCSCDCVPECTGKCGGNDGCGGTCPNYCGDPCETGLWCDRITRTCKQWECYPQCSNRCCGDDGCCGTCPDNCPGGSCCDSVSCECVWGCYVYCDTDDECFGYQCCLHNRCTDMNCMLLECGPDPTCNEECGPCRSGLECDRGRCVEGPVCYPPCPDGSDCVDLDGIGEPECVFPTGKLACVTDAHCPERGACQFLEETCWYYSCGCASDADCAPPEICVTEDGVCGFCSGREPYQCGIDDDCIAAIWLSSCCSLPIPRNISTVSNEECLVEYPHIDPIPVGCEPNCDGFDHCWPVTEEPLVVSCDQGICTIDPVPGP